MEPQMELQMESESESVSRGDSSRVEAYALSSR